MELAFSELYSRFGQEEASHMDRRFECRSDRTWYFLYDGLPFLTFMSSFKIADLTHAKRNWNKTPGYTEAETTAFKSILDPPQSSDAGKFVDIWRRLHPTEKHFTYFSFRFDCRTKGIGWRLDMCRCNSLVHRFINNSFIFIPVVLSERIVDRVKMCEIRSEIYGASDHCPIVMEIAGEL
jgi:AP endonuclease 1